MVKVRFTIEFCINEHLIQCLLSVRFCSRLWGIAREKRQPLVLWPLNVSQAGQTTNKTATL